MIEKRKKIKGILIVNKRVSRKFFDMQFKLKINAQFYVI